jgi:hypothetical protein
MDLNAKVYRLGEVYAIEAVDEWWDPMEYTIQGEMVKMSEILDNPSDWFWIHIRTDFFAGVYPCRDWRVGGLPYQCQRHHSCAEAAVLEKVYLDNKQVDIPLWHHVNADIARDILDRRDAMRETRNDRRVAVLDETNIHMPEIRQLVREYLPPI